MYTTSVNLLIDFFMVKNFEDRILERVLMFASAKGLVLLELIRWIAYSLIQDGILLDEEL
jgi:hypothetical protein